MTLRRFFLLACAFAAPAHAAIVVDGKPDEADWADARVFADFRRTQPYALDAATLATQARMLSTPQGLAFAFRCTQPPGVPRLKPITARDNIGAADRVNVMIDFDADGKTGYNFTVSLSDSIEDAVITDENQFSSDWDADWQHAVHETDEGWTVEILVPWTIASMRGADTPTRTVAVYFDRVVASRSERSATPPVFYGNQVFLSGYEKVEIAQYRAQLLDFFPYLSVLQDLKNPGTEFRGGMDVFWKPGGNFQLTATLNPDFGQVESDELVVNFDAIETYYSDKRPFFTENQGLFDLRTPQDGLILYTRRIGAASDDGSGEAADIDAALKVNGSAGAFKYGFFDAEESGDAGRSFRAARLLAPGETFSIGTLVTSVDRPALDRSALVDATDWRWQASERMRFDGQVIASQVDDAGTTTRGTGGWARWVGTVNDRWEHDAWISHYGADLDFNDAGYMPRNDLNQAQWRTRYKRNDFGADSATAAVTYTGIAVGRTNDDGDRLSPVLRLERSAEFKGGGKYFLQLRGDLAAYDDQIARGAGNVWRPSRTSVWTYYESPRVGDWQYIVGVWLMQEGVNGRAVQWEPEFTYYVSDRLTVDVTAYARFSNDWLIWLDGDRLASYRRKQWDTAVNLNWFPAPRHELRAKMQWLSIGARDAHAWRIGERGRLRRDGTADDFSINSFGVQLRYRYEIAPQSEFYLVYSRGGFERRDGHADDPGELFADALELRDADQLLAKVRYRF